MIVLWVWITSDFIFFKYSTPKNHNIKPILTYLSVDICVCIGTISMSQYFVQCLHISLHTFKLYDDFYSFNTTEGIIYHVIYFNVMNRNQNPYYINKYYSINNLFIISVDNNQFVMSIDRLLKVKWNRPEWQWFKLKTFGLGNCSICKYM